MKRITLALVLSAAATPLLAFGPPFIGIEVRPHAGAFVYARTFHHSTQIAQPLAGTAEGLVNGQRRSVTLRFDTTAEANVFGIRKTWGSDGVWVLNIGTAGEHAGAGAVVGVDRTGIPAFVRFPRTFEGATRLASSREVESMLRALEGNQPLPALSSAGIGSLVRVFGMPLALLTAVAALFLKLVDRVRSRRRMQTALV